PQTSGTDRWDGLVSIDDEPPADWRDQAAEHFADVAEVLTPGPQRRIESFLRAPLPSQAQELAFSHNRTIEARAVKPIQAEIHRRRLTAVASTASVCPVTGAAGLLAHGVLLGWLFGREFTDGTISGLFALPVPGRTVAAAKLTVHLAWSVIASVALLAGLAVLDLAVGLGNIPGDAVPALGRQLALSVLTAAIAVPALWAISAGTEVSTAQLVPIAPVVVAGTALTMLSWLRLQLDR
ncbi:ABC transporter permease, partial [Kribbella italica]